MKRAAIYLRVSTDKQRDNYSIPSQLSECLKYANKMGYSVVGDHFVDPETGKDCPPGNDAIPAYVDDYSSLELYRPGLDAAYDYLEKHGFDVVVVYSIDRLDRDPYKLRVHEYGFYKHKAIVEYVKGEYSDTPEGQFLKNVIASAAQLENEWRTERFNRGKRRKAYTGKILGGWIPYGYEKDKDSPSGLIINEDQAEAVRRIFHYYVNEELSIRGIVGQLNKNKDFIPARSKTWAKSSVSKILTNTAYIGILYYNKSKRQRGLEVKNKRVIREKQEWTRIDIPPIINESLFDAAKERLQYSRTMVRKAAKPEYLLSGFIVCEDCGKAYICESRKPDPKRRTINETRNYRHRKSAGHCSNHIISARKIDNQVWDRIVEFLLNPETIKEGYEQAIEKGKRDNQRELDLLDELNRSNAKIEQRLGNLIKAYTDPDIGMNKDEFLGQKIQIEQERAQIQIRLVEIKSYLAHIPTLEDLKSLEQFTNEARERLQEEEWKPTLENKRWVMKRLNIKVIVSSDQKIKITGMLSNVPGLMDITSTYYGFQRQLPPGRA
jgi:site-specific DNA recombinase